MIDPAQLLGEYARTRSEAAFQELVSRYIDLVYSTAVRLVDGDTHRAEDITQTVFVDLAQTAHRLGPNVMLGGWLHRHTCFVASKVLRAERRRIARERIAMEMNATEDHPNLPLLLPVLDEAVNDLGESDRRAILLRFFEQRDFRSVGAAMATNEDAARKRVHRALEKLHQFLGRRGVTLSLGALTAALGTQAVTAAPAGMAAGIAATALAGATATATASFTLTTIMSMTKIKIAAAAVAAVCVVVPFALQQRNQRKLTAENASLRSQLTQVDELRAENERLAARLAQTGTAPAPTNQQDLQEVLKLRGEVGRLLRENAAANAASKGERPSPLSDITSNPEMSKLIRDQQKLALKAVYKQYIDKAKLPGEQAEKLGELLADNAMENVGHITTVLREKKTPQEANELFSAQEHAFAEKVRELLGPEAYSEYQEYTRNLGSHLSAEQFKAVMKGDKETKNAHAAQLFALMQEERQLALAQAGLDPDYQIIPNLNFRNYAFESEGEKSLQLLESIYARVHGRAAGFLSPENLASFKEFCTQAVNNNRAALAVNRKMMAPATR